MTQCAVVSAEGSSPRHRQSKSLKILVVTNMYPSREEPWWGCFVREQVEDLAALGIEVRVLHFDGRRDKLNYLKAARDVRVLVSRERFDLVHAHYGLTGAVVGCQRQVPTVTTFHGSDCSGDIPWQKYASWIVSRRSHPIFVSDRGRRALRRPSAPVIPAGVDTELFKPIARRTARQELSWQADGRYVLLPGSRSIRTKRADLFDLVVAEARKEVPSLEGVALEGFSRSQAALVLNAVDVTLMTSDYEGSPVTVRESLACMTPVVSVEVGDVPRVISGLPGCGIFPRDPRGLAQGVLRALAANRSAELRRRAERTSRRLVAERLVAFYADLVETDQRQSAGRAL